MRPHSVPEENLSAYVCLYEIETGLRELIIERLSQVSGPFWYKHRLPGDVLKRYREGVAEERKISWSRLVPHHPLYYIDFPDLKKVIGREDNWHDVFESIFLRKDVLMSTLSELEPIRNKIAHNRKTTREDVTIATAAYAKLSAALGEQRLAALAARCTDAKDVLAHLRDLRAEAETTFAACKALSPVPSLSTWPTVSNAWWFDASYLGHEITSIVAYFEMLTSYQSLPRTRGSGHLIEAWLSSSGLGEMFLAAADEFNGVLQAEGARS